MSSLEPPTPRLSQKGSQLSVLSVLRNVGESSYMLEFVPVHSASPVYRFLVNRFSDVRGLQIRQVDKYFNVSLPALVRLGQICSEQGFHVSWKPLPSESKNKT